MYSNKSFIVLKDLTSSKTYHPPAMISTSRSDAIICRLDKVKNQQPNSLTLVVLILFYRRRFSKAWIQEKSLQLCCCVCFKGWLRVYYGLDLLVSKLSKALSCVKFREQNRHPKNIMSTAHCSFGDLYGKIYHIFVQGTLSHLCLSRTSVTIAEN